MPIEWNPNDPPIEGMEHLPVGWGHVPSNNYQDQWAITFKSQHTGPLTHIRLFIPYGSQTAANNVFFGYQNSPVVVDLVAEGNEDTGEPTVDMFVPTNLGTFSLGFSLLDYTANAPTLDDINGLEDGSGLVAYAFNAFFDVQFDTAAFALNRRVMRMGLSSFVTAPWRAQRAINGAADWEAVIVAYQPTTRSATSFYHGDFIVTGSGAGTNKWQPTTPQFVRDFRNAGPHFYRIICHAGAGSWFFDHVRMHVVSVPENRIGVGAATYNPLVGATTGGQYVHIPLTTPAGTGSPSVTSGQKYTMIVRRNNGDSHYTSTQFAQAPFRYLRGVPLDPNDFRLRPVIQKIPEGAIADNDNNDYWLNGTIEVVGLGDDVEGIPVVRFSNGTSASQFLNMSQGYEYSWPGALWGPNAKKDVIPATNAPATGCEMYQFIRVSGGPELYGQVGLVLGTRALDPQPNGPVEVEVYHPNHPEFGGTVVLGPTQLTYEQWNAAPYNIPYNDTDEHGVRYKYVRVRFDNSTALPSGAAVVHIQAPGCDESRQWKVGTLHTLDRLANIESVGTMGGGSEFAAEEGRIFRNKPGSEAYTGMSSATRASDIQVHLMTVPPPPTGFAVEALTVAAYHVTGETCGNPTDPLCGEETIPGIKLTWHPLTDPMITSYQIQRMDSYDTEWAFVAEVGAIVSGAPVVTGWEDYECRIGVPTCYRVRGRRSDGITGDWSAEGCAFIEDNRVSLCFTSNAATGMGCVYPEMWEGSDSPELAFEFAEFTDVERRLIYGKDGQSSFHPTERRGDVFSRIVLLNAIAAVSKPSLEITKPIRDLAWVQIPYVCIRDGQGNRWFGSIDVPNASNRKRAELWFAEITVIEGTRTPFIYDNRNPQVTSV